MELFAADGHDAGGCERVTGKSGMRPVILASLSGHVRLKVDHLGDALSLELRETDRILLADLLDEHDTLTRRVSEFDRYIDQALASHAEACRLLETIPGIDRTSACAILIEAGPDVAVFGADRRLAAWAGVCPGNNESAGKRRSGRGQRGNKTLCAVLVECAHAAARTHNCQFRAYHKALMVRRATSARSAPPRTSSCDPSSRFSGTVVPTATRTPTTRPCSSGATRRAGCASSTSSCATTTALSRCGGRLSRTRRKRLGELISSNVHGSAAGLGAGHLGQPHRQ